MKSCRFLQRCPGLYLDAPIRPTISQCALAAATLNHRDAFSSVMKYLRDLVHVPVDMALVCVTINSKCVTGLLLKESECSMKRAVMQQFLSDNGQVLMDGELRYFLKTLNQWSFSALVSGFINLPSVMLPDSVEVLFALTEGAKEVCKR